MNTRFLLFLLPALALTFTSCEPDTETVVLGKEVDGELVLAKGVVLQDTFQDGFKLINWNLHTNPGRFFLYRELSNGQVTQRQYIELDRSGEGELSYTFGMTSAQRSGDVASDNALDPHAPGDEADDNDIDALPEGKDPCDERVCPISGLNCQENAKGDCQCGSGSSARNCVLKTVLKSKRELVKAP